MKHVKFVDKNVYLFNVTFTCNAVVMKHSSSAVVMLEFCIHFIILLSNTHQTTIESINS